MYLLGGVLHERAYGFGRVTSFSLVGENAALALVEPLMLYLNLHVARSFTVLPLSSTSHFFTFRSYGAPCSQRQAPIARWRI